MNSETMDDRAPGKWVSSCQRCLNYLFLDQNEYTKFIRKYYKSLNTLFISLSTDESFDVQTIEMIEFFELLYRSNLTGIDFPLCSSCLESVKQDHIRDLNKDKTVGYVLERLIGAMTVQQKMDSVKIDQVEETSQEEETSVVINKTVDELQEEKDTLKEKIQSLRVSLATVEKQKLELEELELELAKLQDTMNTVTSEISIELSDHSLRYNKEKESVEDHKRQLELLMHYSVLNDAFTIWFEENAITINGVKASRVGNQIDWNAVNAILGDLAQVVDAMYHLYGKTYSSLVIKPMGSFSEMIDYANKTSYSLHANQKTWKTKLFSSALHLFLEAVQDLAKHCYEKFKVEIRYPIENDCVGGYDFLMNDFDTWTSALRLLAIDIKQLIVYSYTATLRIKKH